MNVKLLHNEHVSLAWAIIVELVVHGLFAFGALLLGGFLGEIVLGKSGQTIGAWILALFIFGAAFQAFVLGEYMREHVNAYEATTKGDGSYLRNWKAIQWIVGGLEVSSLAFRCLVVIGQGQYLQATVVGVFGGLALWYAYAQAKVIHASVNRPVEYDLMAAQHRAGHSLVKDAIDYMDDMTPEQKARFVAGDTSAVEEVAEEKYLKEQRRRRAQEQEEAERTTQELVRRRIDEEARQQHERATGMAHNIFKPETWKRTRETGQRDFQDAQLSQADQLSHQNGHRN